MRYLLFAVLFFALPHVDWVPRRLGIDQADIPFGFGNWLLGAAVILGGVGGLTRSGTPNPFRSFTTLVTIVGLGLELRS